MNSLREVFSFLGVEGSMRVGLFLPENTDKVKSAFEFGDPS